MWCCRRPGFDLNSLTICKIGPGFGWPPTVSNARCVQAGVSSSHVDTTAGWHSDAPASAWLSSRSFQCRPVS